MMYLFRYRKEICLLCLLAVVLSFPINGMALTSKKSGPYTVLIQEDICMLSGYDPSESLSGRVSVPGYYTGWDEKGEKIIYSVVGIKNTAFRGKTLSSLDILVGDSERVKNYGYQLEKYSFQKTEVGLSSDDPKAVFRGGAITAIGEGAFEEARVGCDLVFENIRGTIHANAFSGAEIDGRLEFSGTIDEIGTHAFSGAKMKGLTLPKDTRCISDEALKDTGSYDFVIPDNLEKLGSRIFMGCELKTVTLPGTNAERDIAEDAFPDQEGLEIIIPEDLTDISAFHFENYHNLIFRTAPDLPDDSPVISYLKEKHLSYKKGEQGEIIKPSSPETPTSSPTETPTSSPTQTPTLSPTQTPTSSPTQTPTLSPTQTPTLSPTQTPMSGPTRMPTQLPTAAVPHTPAPTQEQVSTTEPPVTPERKQISVARGDKKNRIYSVKNIRYKIKGGSSVTVLGTAKIGSKKISIPATVKIDGKLYKVTGIKSKAFRNQKKLQSVLIGNYVADVGDEAFAYCTRLRKIQFGTGLKSLGRRVLYKDRKLKKILFKGKKLKSIGRHCFSGVPSRVDIRAVRTKVKAYAKLINRSKK